MRVPSRGHHGRARRTGRGAHAQEGRTACVQGLRVAGRVYPASGLHLDQRRVVHGIPSPRRVLRDGDIVGPLRRLSRRLLRAIRRSPVPVGRVTPEAERSCGSQRRRSRPVSSDPAGAHVGDISGRFRTRRGSRVFDRTRIRRSWHGRSLHEDPQVPNYRTVRPRRPAERRSRCWRSSRW